MRVFGCRGGAALATRVKHSLRVSRRGMWELRLHLLMLRVSAQSACRARYAGSIGKCSLAFQDVKSGISDNQGPTQGNVHTCVTFGCRGLSYSIYRPPQ